VVGGLTLVLAGGCTRPRKVPDGRAEGMPVASEVASRPPLGGHYGAREVGSATVVGREQVDALNRGAIQALEQHNYEGAMDKAKASMAIDKTSAFPYLYLGTALIELDRRTEARQVFIACTRDATSGPLTECQRFLQ
jgi:hypothetical protein